MVNHNRNHHSTSADGEKFENLGPDLVVPVRCSDWTNKGTPAPRFIEEIDGKVNKSGKPPKTNGGKVAPSKAPTISRRGNPPTLSGLQYFVMVIAPCAACSTRLRVDLCDCTAPQYAGVVNYSSYARCLPFATQVCHIPIEYQLYVEQKDGKTFAGYVCRTWEKVKIVEKGIFWNTDTIFQEYSEEHRRPSAARWSKQEDGVTMRCKSRGGSRANTRSLAERGPKTP